MKMEIKTVTGESELRQCLTIRREVFIREQNVPEEIEIDEFDVLDKKKSIHFIVNIGGKAVATGRIKFIAADTVQFNRVAVKKEHRGSGIGARLVLFMEKESAKLGYKKVFLESQLHAKVFYDNLGYENLSAEPFMEAGIPHVAMQKNIGGEPDEK